MRHSQSDTHLESTLQKDFVVLVCRGFNFNFLHNSDIFKNLLSGRYVPFGVFRIFNDPCLDKVLEMFFQLVVSIPEVDLLVRSLIPFTHLEVLSQTLVVIL